MNNPKVNVLILNWNGQSVLNNCIKSVINNNYSNFSITVIDNNSNDHSINNLICKDKIKIIKLDYNYGYSKGYNIVFKRLKKSNDDFYLILNNDTVLDKDAISILVDGAVKFGKKNIYGPKIINLNNNRNWYCGGRINFLTGIVYHLGLNKIETNIVYKTSKTDYISGCCMLISKNTLNQLNGFNEKYKMYYEDVDLCLRAKKNNVNCYFISESIVYHKISHSIGGRYSYKKNIIKLISFIKYLYYSNNLFYFFYYCLINLFLAPFYLFKLVTKINYEDI